MRLVALHCSEGDEIVAGGKLNAEFHVINRCKIAGFRVHQSNSHLIFRILYKEGAILCSRGFHWTESRIPIESLNILVDTDQFFSIEIENPSPFGTTILADVIVDAGDLNYDVPGIELISVLN